MYSICSLDQDDVLNSIIAMKQRGYRGPVIQTTNQDYERLKYQTTSVRPYADSLLAESSLTINLFNNTLHKEDCPYLQSTRASEKELVPCHIIDQAATGLKLCSCCQ